VSHERWEETAAAYALDAIDAAELGAFEAHLSVCSECRRTVQQFRDVAGVLALASPPVGAPDSLGPRVIAAVRRDVSRPPRFRPVPWLAAAAVVALAVTGGVIARRASVTNDALRLRVAELAAAVAARDSSLGSLVGTEVHMVSLAEPGRAPVARVFWNHEESRFVVTSFGLPPAPAGRTYQLWAMPEGGGAPLSMGTFDPGQDGRATVVLPVSAEIRSVDVITLCLVTVEPVGGSPGPTETPRLSGRWIHAD
jgi:anti-sigma-K factor RskA